MDFDALVSPLGREAFLDRFRRGRCTLIHGGAPERFAQLISLEEIELRLNDGCNTLLPPQIIRHGERSALVDKGLPWTPFAVRKREVLELLRAGHSLMMMNLSQLNPAIARLVDSIEQAFELQRMRADVHLYVSTQASASGYDAHRDRPQHKLYLQAIGSTHWQVFAARTALPESLRSVPAEEESEMLELVDEFDLLPGDVYYMPPGVFHRIGNREGPRVSLSIPFSRAARLSTPRMDRTFIPFKALFLEAVDKQPR